MVQKLKLSEFWIKVFGVKVGDIVRLKYGRVFWEIYAINTYDGIRYLKIRRMRYDREGDFTGSLAVTCNDWEIVEVSSKEAVGDTFPSDLK